MIIDYTDMSEVESDLILFGKFFWYPYCLTLLSITFFLRLNDNDVRLEDDYYAYWAGSVIGPFVHILAIAHVLLWGLPSSVVGSIVS